MITVIARMNAQKGKEAEFEAAMTELAREVRNNEPGCKLYQLCRGKESGQYVMVERYENQDALTAHGQAEHFKAARPKLGSVVDGRAQIELLTEVD